MVGPLFVPLKNNFTFFIFRLDFSQPLASFALMTEQQIVEMLKYMHSIANSGYIITGVLGLIAGILLRK